MFSFYDKVSDFKETLDLIQLVKFHNVVHLKHILLFLAQLRKVTCKIESKILFPTSRLCVHPFVSPSVS